MMISTHFNMDINLCPGSTSEQIYRTAWDQLQTILGGQKFLELKTYLEQNWYDGEMFMIWGRRNEHGVPFARTTMHMEGH